MADIWADPAALASRRSAKYRRYLPDVLPLWVAEMDVELAEPIRTALIESIAISDTGYAHAGGLPEAYAAFARRRYGVTVDPGRIMALPDIMRGVSEILRVITDPGDGVVVNTPVYPPFFAHVADVERRIVSSPLAVSSDGYRLDLERLESDFVAGARAYLLCNPHNPTGLVLSRDELEAVADLAERYSVRVVADEVHAPLTYPGVVHTPFSSLDRPASRSAVTLVSASKAWNLAGLKCALVIAGEDAWADAQRMTEDVFWSPALPGIIANQAAFEHGEPWLEALLGALDGNRRLFERLRAAHLPEVGFHLPDATYLAWLDLRAYGLGDDPATVLVERAKVALSEGPAFGEEGRGFARLNIASSPERLTEAVERLAAVLNRR
jgi:cysteine-S-conjugate beta-lyase